MRCFSLLLLMLLVRSAAAEPPADSERIAAMEKVADYALVPPTLNTSPLPEYDTTSSITA
jgi:hypothetical protein